MTTGGPTPMTQRSRQGRRALLILTAVILAAAALSIAVVVHTSAGPPGSFSFGPSYFARIGSVILGPAVLGWAIWSITRGRAWTTVACVLASCTALLATFVAVYQTVSFRPLIGCSGYDRAVGHIAAEVTSLTTFDPARKDRIRSLRPRLRSADGNRATLQQVIGDCDELIAGLESDQQRCREWPSLVRQSFRDQGVGVWRANEYLLQTTPSMSFDEFIRVNDDLIEQIRIVRGQAAEALR